MRYFLDTEFWERPGSIQLISLALVAEDGRELYLENSDFIWGDCTSQWLHDNVRPYLVGGEHAVPYREIGDRIRDFVGIDQPEFWAYYADYDWVTFCWTFGSMIDLPENWPMFCMDLKQVIYQIGNPPMPGNPGTDHNALDDARHVKQMYDYLVLRESALRDMGVR